MCVSQLLSAWLHFPGACELRVKLLGCPGLFPLLRFDVGDSENSQPFGRAHRLDRYFKLVPSCPRVSITCAVLYAISNDLSGNYGFLKFIFFLASFALLASHCSLFNSIPGVVVMMHLKCSKELNFSKSLLLHRGSIFPVAWWIFEALSSALWRIFLILVFITLEINALWQDKDVCKCRCVNNSGS